jgi:acyl-CoA synthetase (AMP-forming)/AMP-acid ligase II
LDLIRCAKATTFDGLFRRRCEKIPEGEAFRQHAPARAQWKSFTWRYRNNPEKTREAIDSAGWQHTGDIARINADGHVYIGGRLEDILVMSSGEKVPPGNLGLAIA